MYVSQSTNKRLIDGTIHEAENSLESALAEIEHLKKILNGLGERICQFRVKDYTITYVNEAYVRYFELPADALIGHSLLEQVDEYRRPILKASIDKLVKMETPNVSDEMVVEKDGRQVWYRWTDTPIFNRQGEVEEIRVVAREVTEEKLLQSKLSAGERRYRTIVDSMQTRMCRFRPDNFVLTFVNQAYCAFWGKSEEALLGSSILSLALDEDRPQLIADIEEVATSRQKLIKEVTRIHYADNSKIWYQRLWVPIFNDQGEVEEIQSLYMDITELKISELALENKQAELIQANRQLYAIADNIPVWIAYLDRDYRFQFANKYYQTATGLNHEEMIGKTADQVLSPEGFAQSKPHYDRALAGETVYFEKTTPAKIHQGEAIVGLTFIPDEIDGEIKGLYALGVDLTEAQQKERFIEAVTRSLPNFIYLFSLSEQRNIYVNRDLWTELGYSVADIHTMGDRFLPTVMHPDDWAKQADHWETLMDSQPGEVITREYRVKHKDGSWRWLISYETIFTLNREEGVVEILGTGLDITERKRLEEEVREKQDFLASITDNMPAWICYIDREERFQFVNKNYETAIDRPYTALIGTPVKQFLSKTAYANSREHYRRVFQGRHQTWQTEIVNKQGYRLKTQVNATPHFVNGKVVGMFLVAFDMTELIAAQEQVRRSEQTLRTATAVSPTGLFRTDQHGRIVYINERAIDIIGLPMEACFGYSWTTTVHPEDQEELFSLWQQAIKNEAPLRAEFRIRHRNGKTLSVITETRPIKSDTGKIEGHVGAIFDLTQIRQASDEIARLNLDLKSMNSTLEARVDERTETLEKVNQALLKTNAELGRFVSIASHDLKEPLRGIQNYLTMINSDHMEEISAEGQTLLKNAHQLSFRAIELIEDLRNYSRIGLLEDKLQEIELNTIIDEVIEICQPFQEEGEINFIYPSIFPRFTYNPAHIRTIILNLVSNGIKYNQAEVKEIEIGLYSGPRTAKSDAPIIFVRDNGIGIPPKHHTRIFEMFKRLHPQHRYGGGTGAGLALVHKIIESNGGAIWLESNPENGTGTTFFVDLSIQTS